MLSRLAACLSLLIPCALAAQEAPPGGEPLYAKSVIEVLKVTNDKKGTVELVPLEGQPFKQALRCTTTENSEKVWEVQAEAMIDKDLKAGDVILAEFWMRAVKTSGEAGEASSIFILERFGEPWTKAVEYSLSAGPSWRKYSIPFAMRESWSAQKCHLCFRMGYRPQAFELADVKIVNYGNTVKIDALPKTKLTYGGEEADAPWRKEAAARIENIRKGDLTVMVKDPKLKPVPGAKVAVRMKRHAYGFGSAVVASKLATQEGDNPRYQKEVERLFSRVVFENDLKWGPWEQGAVNAGWRRSDVEGAMKWLRMRNIEVRGHNMVWGTWRYIPPEVRKLEGDPKALEQAIEKRINDVGGTLKGQLAEWDVINEPVVEKDLVKILGESAMATWFKIARQADPNAVLFVNDYPSPDAAGHLDAFDKIIRMLLNNGAPVGGIGLQGHVGGSPWAIPVLLKALDQLGVHGLPVAITEYDTNIEDPDLDARFFKDMLTAVFSHPSTNGFLMWGFWDGAHWQSKAPLFKRDWTEKPAGKAYEELVLRDWWTNTDGTTDEKGSFATRGFQGDYEVTVTAAGKTVTVPARLPKDGLQLPVVLK